MAITARRRPGFAITGCLSGCMLCLLAAWVCIQLFRAVVRDDHPLPPIERKPHKAPPRALRPAEFQADLLGYGPLKTLYVSSKTDRFRVESYAAAAFGTLSQPTKGWTVVLPAEKAYIRYWPGRLDQMSRSGLWQSARKMRDTVDSYAMSAVGETVRRLTVEPELAGAERWLEKRGAYQVEIQLVDQTRLGTSWRGFEKRHFREYLEFCPELGLLFRWGPPESSNALEVRDVEEHPLSPALFQPPPGYRELFSVDHPDPEPAPVLQGLLPSKFKIGRVFLTKKPPGVEEHWSWAHGQVHTIVVKRYTQISLEDAEKVLRSDFQRYRFRDKGWDEKAEVGEKSFHPRPSVLAFYQKKTLITLGYYPETNGELVLDVARKLAKR